MPSSDQQQDRPAKQGKFLLSRFTDAFAKLSGTVKEEPVAETPSAESAPASLPTGPAPTGLPDEGGVVTPQMIVEGMLFVGFDDDRPISSRMMAAQIRDVSPAEVDEIVGQLNGLYDEEACPWEIVSTGGGYRMQLRGEFDRVRDNFLGRTREAKLSTAAMEVLSVVAYKQPITADEVKKLRGSRSKAILNQLVRRQLLRLDRPEQSPHKPWYHTTDRFNRLFGLQSLDDLPRSEDLDDA